jgi:hypothetical protein
MDTVMQWVGPTLDVLAIALLGGVLWRLGPDRDAAWGERETRLRALFDELRTLVAQSEGLARDLDATLAERETRMQALVASATTATPSRTQREARREVRDEDVADASGDPAETAMRIERLAAAGTAVEEIARRLGVAPAEVRLVIGLKAAHAARRRTDAMEAVRA